MDSLPKELISMILSWVVQLLSSQKNRILEIRLVCRKFDDGLRSTLFQTLQLEFSRILAIKTGSMSADTLGRVSDLASSIYLDMMIVRDEQEIQRLGDIFGSLSKRVPEMAALIASLRQYCLNESTFMIEDYAKTITTLLHVTLNATRLRLNLPFPVVGVDSDNDCSTQLLANTMAGIAQRPDDAKHITTLVLDHLSECDIDRLCTNHLDVTNLFTVFSKLKHLVISLRRPYALGEWPRTFRQNFWLMLRQAEQLESLCVTGGKLGDKHRYPNVSSQTGRRASQWVFSYLEKPLCPNIGHLRCLELRRMDIEARCFLALISDNAATLKELYLNEVYLKHIRHGVTLPTEASQGLWVGHPSCPSTTQSPWIADTLHAMPGLNLQVVRVHQLGYTHFAPRTWTSRDATLQDFDVVDPSTRTRSLDERFISAIFGVIDEPFTTSSLSSTPGLDSQVPSVAPGFQDDYASGSWRLSPSNSTSRWKYRLDDTFYNHNELALTQLHRIIEVADQGMAMISAEINNHMHEAEDQVRQFGTTG